MLQIQKEKILERWDNLSDHLKDAIFADETYDVINSISEKYSLTENQANILTADLLNVLRGFLNYDEFWKSLKSDLDANDEVSSRIFMEVKEKIFNSLDNEIKLAYSPLKEISNLTPMENIKEPQTSSTEIKPIIASPISITKPITQTEFVAVNIPIPIPLPPKKEISPEPLIETSIAPLPSWVASPVLEAPVSPAEPANNLPESNIITEAPTAQTKKTESTIPPSEIPLESASSQETVAPIPAPFIFHQEENPIVSVISSEKGINYQPLKPIFYGDNGTSEENKVGAFAKLEFGSTPTVATTPQTTPQNIPPTNNLTLKKSTGAEKTIVPEENILNLKDLPQ